MKLVIFDCDGTLVSSEYVNNLAISRAAQMMGFTDYPVEECIQKFRGKNLSLIVEKIIAEQQQYVEPQIFLNAIKKMALSLTSDITAVDNVHQTLKDLNLYKCVASNGNREAVIASLVQTEIFPFFKEAEIFTHEQVARPKPFPDLFLYAAKHFGVSPEDSLVIEDSETGVEAARAAGMQVLGFTGTAFEKPRRAAKLQEAGATAIIDDIAELFNFI